MSLHEFIETAENIIEYKRRFKYGKKKKNRKEKMLQSVFEPIIT